MNYILKAVPKYNEIYAPISLVLLQYFFIKRSWLHCNPSNNKLNKKSLLKYYFINNENVYLEDKKNNKKYLLNEKDFLSLIEHKVIYFVGNKGYGKTTVENFLFMKYTKTLNKEGLTHLRIDVSKIYRKWNKLKSTSFESYLYIQIVYVFVRYYKSISDDYSYDEVFNKYYMSIKKDIDKNNLSIVFDNILSKLRVSLNNHNKFEEKEFLNQNNNFKDVMKIAKIILNHLSSKIILVIDGIDNLDYDSTYRNDLINEIKSLSFNHLNTSNFKCIIIALREENLKYFDTSGFEQNYYQNQINTIKLDLSNISFKDLIQNDEILKINKCTTKEAIDNLIIILKAMQDITSKDEVIQKQISNIFHIINEHKHHLSMKSLLSDNQLLIAKDGEFFEINKKLPTSIYQVSFDIESKYNMNIDVLLKTALYFFEDNELNEIYTYLNNFENNLLKCLKFKDIIFDKNDIFNIIFGHSLREMLSHAINSFLYIKQFIKRKNSNINVNEYLSKHNNYLLVMEAVFKNGNLYGINNDDIKFLGYFKNISFINLFNIELKEYVSILPLDAILGLYLLENNKSLDKLKLSKENLEIIYQKFVEYEYIKENRNSYYITKKGKMILEYSFRDINILGTYCYGGIFTKKYQRIIKVYDTNWSNYISVTLFNVTILIKYVLEEIKIIKNNFNHKKILKQFKKLVLNKHLKNDFLFFYNKLSSNKDAKQTFINELEKENLYNTFKNLIGIANVDYFIDIGDIDLIKFMKTINFPFNKEIKIKWKITIIKHYAQRDSEQFMNSNYFQKFVFSNHFDYFDDEIKYLNRLKDIKDIKFSSSDIELINSEVEKTILILK